MRSLLAAGGGGFRRGLRRAACARFFMGDAGGVLATPVAIDGAFALGVARLPRDTRGIVDPGFLGLGIAAGGLALLDDVAAGLTQARIDLVQLVGVLDLDAEMIETWFAPARGDREIDARILQHPFRIVGFDQDRK